MKLHRIGLVIALGLLASPSPAQMPPQRTTGGQINLIRPRNRGIQPRCTTVRSVPNMPATTTCEPSRGSAGVQLNPVPGGQPGAGSQATPQTGTAGPTP